MGIEYLYKYGRLSEYSEALFTKAEIYFQSPVKLNDPFECRPHFTFNGTNEDILEVLSKIIRRSNPLITEENARVHAASIIVEGRQHKPETWENLRREVLDLLGIKIGMYCMSEIPSNILMWSHYSDNHKGFCLKFEATDNTPMFGAAQKVEYKKEYPIVDFFNTPNEVQVDLIFLTKYEDWRYEAEWRVIDHESGPGLKSYPIELLKGVVFGMRMNDDDEALIRSWVAKRRADVQFYKAEQDESKYLINLREID